MEPKYDRLDVLLASQRSYLMDKIVLIDRGYMKVRGEDSSDATLAVREETEKQLKDIGAALERHRAHKD